MVNFNIFQNIFENMELLQKYFEKYWTSTAKSMDNFFRSPKYLDMEFLYKSNILNSKFQISV